MLVDQAPQKNKRWSPPRICLTNPSETPSLDLSLELILSHKEYSQIFGDRRWSHIQCRARHCVSFFWLDEYRQCSKFNAVFIWPDSRPLGTFSPFSSHDRIIPPVGCTKGVLSILSLNRNPSWHVTVMLVGQYKEIFEICFESPGLYSLLFQLLWA